MVTPTFYHFFVISLTCYISIPSFIYNLEFHIGKETIDIVHGYTYLGTCISSTGNFNISLEHLKEKALHALFSLRKHTNFSKLKPSLACKIFEAMISPILSYNSEIWGVYVKHDFKAWDNTRTEKTLYYILYLLRKNKDTIVNKPFVPR